MTTAPQIWNALPLPTLIVDGKNAVIDANGPAEGFLNRSLRSLRGAPLTDLLEVEGGLQAAISRVRRNGAPLSLHDTALRAGAGPAVRSDLHLSALDESAVMILIAPQQIADRLDRARSSRRAARSAVGMAEMLAHEIKNPLAGITGAAQLLSMNLAGEDLELTELIVAETRRVVKLLEQVEQFGNLRPPQRKSVNLHDVLDHARRSAMVGFAAHMDISEAYDPSLPHAWADADQLQQIVLNLMRNAAQVGKQGGHIRIRTFYELSMRVRRPDGSGVPVPLQIEITDDGPGIPEEMQGNIFEPFVSGRENGTGLGLALVAKIVSEHDGLITVDSRPGQTTFRLSLPMAPRLRIQ